MWNINLYRVIAKQRFTNVSNGSLPWSIINIRKKIINWNYSNLAKKFGEICAANKNSKPNIQIYGTQIWMSKANWHKVINMGLVITQTCKCSHQ